MFSLTTRSFPVRSAGRLSHALGVDSRRRLNGFPSGSGLRWASTKKKKETKRKEEHQHQPSDVPDKWSDFSHLEAELFSDHLERSSVPEPLLSSEQQALIDFILTGRNVFYTGAAGTGKSLVLRTVVRRLRDLGNTVEVVAPTGRAALAVNGTTTWSYAGWAPSAHAHPLELLRKWSLSDKNIHRLANTDVLVIDEISMVENHHLERLSEIMKEARAHACYKGWDHAQKIQQSAFGGCQIIATGDFFQLPPVRPFQHCIECGSPLRKKLRQGETTYCCPYSHGNWADSSKWAFQSEAWDNADFAHVELKQIYRQAGDPIFIELLNRFRSGTFTNDDIKVLIDPSRETKDLTNAVRLYPTRAEVARYNDDRLRELKTPPHNFIARDSFHWNEEADPHLKTHCVRQANGTLAALREHQYEPFLSLKVGMPVILLSNLNIRDGLVNGSQGVVVNFTFVDSSFPYRRKKPKDDATDDYISDIIDNERTQYATSSTNPVVALPVVQFDNGATEVIYPECSAQEMRREAPPEPDTYSWGAEDFLERPVPSVLCRTQIPLIAGWAMSVHRAQGMSLDKVIVDLTRAFEEGQVYVALSRARSLDGLKVEGDPRGLLARREGNQEVKDFYLENFNNQV